MEYEWSSRSSREDGEEEEEEEEEEGYLTCIVSSKSRSLRQVEYDRQP